MPVGLQREINGENCSENGPTIHSRVLRIGTDNGKKPEQLLRRLPGTGPRGSVS